MPICLKRVFFPLWFPTVLDPHCHLSCWRLGSLSEIVFVLKVCSNAVACVVCVSLVCLMFARVQHAQPQGMAWSLGKAVCHLEFAGIDSHWQWSLFSFYRRLQVCLLDVCGHRMNAFVSNIIMQSGFFLKVQNCCVKLVLKKTNIYYVSVF